MATNKKKQKFKEDKHESRSHSRSGPSTYRGSKSRRQDNDKREDNNTRRRDDWGSSTNYDKCHTNDISWWNKAKPVYENVTKIPFNRLYGDPFVTAPRQTSLGWNGIPNVFNPPAVMAIDYIPTIGTANDASDAVNLAFDSLWAKIYREYTGAANFTKSELAFHVLHAQGIATYIAECKRILRTLNSYALMNHNFPRALYSAVCGTDVEGSSFHYFQQDVSALPSLRAQLNQTIYNFNTLFLPNFTDVFKRWYSLSSNVWMDEDSISATAYIFRVSGHYEYQEATISEQGEVTPAKLVWMSNPATASTNTSRFVTLLGYANTLLSEIRNSANFAIVNAAIAKVFQDNLMQIEAFQENEVIQPVFDRNMMYQINNMDVCGYLRDLDVTEDVTQNTLIYAPKATSQYTNCLGYKNTHLLNSYDYNQSDEFLMESTRLKINYVYGNPRLQNLGSDTSLDIATEICIGITFYTRIIPFTETGVAGNPIVRASMKIQSNAILLQWDNNGSQVIVEGPIDNNMLHFFDALSKFRNHPFIYLSQYGYDGEGHAPTTVSQSMLKHIIGDVSLYTTLSDEGLQGLNRAALLSVYYVGN